MTHLLKDDLLSLKEKLEGIEKEFQDKLKLVDENSKKFVEADNKLEQLVKKNDFFISLNIGGKIFKLKLSSLIKKKDTLFYNVLIDYSDSGSLPTELFFDRSYVHFPIILTYLRSGVLASQKLQKFEKEELNTELEYYGLKDIRNKRHDIELYWDQNLSKQGMCTVDPSEKQKVTVHSTSCYCHFVTDRTFDSNDNDFYVELESTVTQNDSYYYIGLVTESYSYTGSCMCCNPVNAYYVQCNGTIHINSTTNTNTAFNWQSEKVNIGIKVSPREKKIQFFLPDKEIESDTYCISTGNNFRIVAGHCNTGSGSITISKCYSTD
jgi:hypothetical protein